MRLMVDGPFRCHCSDNSVNFRGEPLYEFRLRFKIRVPKNISLDLRTVNSVGHSRRRDGGRFQDQQREWRNRDAGRGRRGVGAAR